MDVQCMPNGRTSVTSLVSAKDDADVAIAPAASPGGARGSIRLGRLISISDHSVAALP